jgi:hypothetical protein
MIKDRYKKELLQLLLSKQGFKAPTLIRNAIRATETPKIRNCLMNGLKEVND